MPRPRLKKSSRTAADRGEARALPPLQPGAGSLVVQARCHRRRTGFRANEDHHRPAGAHRRCRRGGFDARRWACFRANHGGTARFAGPLPAHPRTRRRVSADHRPDPLRGELGADDDVRARRGRRGHRTCRCAPPRCGRQSHPRSAFHGLDTNQAAYDALHAAGVDIKWAPNDAIYHQKPSSSTTLSPPSVPETSPRSTTRPRPMPTFSPPAPATSPPSPPPSTPTSPTSTSQVSARSGIASAGVRSTSRPSSVPTRPARPQPMRRSASPGLTLFSQRAGLPPTTAWQERKTQPVPKAPAADRVPDKAIDEARLAGLPLSGGRDEEVLAALGALPALPHRGFTAGHHRIGAGARAAWAFR